MSRKVAIVTGANKGIGFAIVRGLCKDFDGDVYLTARDVDRGKEAVADLEKEGLKPKFHKLDLKSHETIEALKKFMVDNYGGLDLLVNNAGMAYKMAATESFEEQAEVTVATNFWGTLDVCKTLFPILRPHARVVNVSSMVSTMALGRCGPEAKKKVLAAKTVADVEKFMVDFMQSVKSGNYKSDGWPETAYGMSKVGVTALSIAQQGELDKDAREDIVVNCCCPGFVNTDMSSHKGHLTIDQGAETPLYLALLPANCESPRGKYLSQKKIQKWE